MDDEEEERPASGFARKIITVLTGANRGESAARRDFLHNLVRVDSPAFQTVLKNDIRMRGVGAAPHAVVVVVGGTSGFVAAINCSRKIRAVFHAMIEIWL